MPTRPLAQAKGVPTPRTTPGWAVRPRTGFAAGVALWISLVLGPAASAHLTEDYLQAARIELQPDRVVVTLDLVPGMAVAESFLAEVDHDGDGAMSEKEQRAYAEQVLGDLELAADEHFLQPHLVSWTFPEPSALRRGEGTLRLTVEASLPRLTAGPHQILFRNSHLDGHSAYLANALVPQNARLTVTDQRRDLDQSELVIDYAVADSPRTAAAWVLGSLAAGLVVVYLRRIKGARAASIDPSVEPSPRG